MADQLQLERDINSLKAKSMNYRAIHGGLAILGGVAGVIIATRMKKKSVLTKVGYYIAGSLIVGIPAGFYFIPKMNETTAAIKSKEAEINSEPIIAK